MTLTEKDDGKTIEANVGDALVLRLHEPATAGYRWAFEGLDAAAVRVREEESAQPAGRPGAPREVVWTLTPKKPGRWRVALRLRRRCESSASESTRFEITVAVAARAAR